MTTGRFLRPLIVPIIALSIVVAAVVAPASSVANCNPCLPPPNEWPQFQHDGQHTALQFSGYLRQFGTVARHQHQVVTILCEQFSEFQSDTAGSAGDESGHV